MSCSSCLPTVGKAKDCERKGQGGYQTEFWLIPSCKLADSPFVDGYSTGVITDITLADPSYKFLSVVVLKDTFSADPTSDPVTRRVNVKLSFKVSTYGADSDRITAAEEARAFMQGLIDSNEPITFIYKDRDGVRRVAHRLEVAQSNYEGGKAMNDVPGMTFNYEGQMEVLPYILDSSYVIPT